MPLTSVLTSSFRSAHEGSVAVKTTPSAIESHSAKAAQVPGHDDLQGHIVTLGQAKNAESLSDGRNQSVAALAADAAAGHFAAAEPALGEERAPLNQEVEQQEKSVANGFFAWMRSIGGSMVEASTQAFVSRYHLEDFAHDADEPASQDLAPRAQATVSSRDAAAPLTAAQTSKMSIAQLEGEVAEAVRGLILYLNGLNNTALVKQLDQELHALHLGGVAAFTREGAQALRSTEDAAKQQATWTDSLRGYAQAIKSSAVKLGAAAALPSLGNLLAGVTDSVVGSLGIRTAAHCAATYLAVDTVSKFPELKDDATFKSCLERAKVGLTALTQKLDALKSQESMRQDFGDRVVLVSKERQQFIRGLKLEKGAIEKALAEVDKTPSVGTGEARKEVLKEAAAAHSAFHAFFLSIGRGVGRAIMWVPNMIYDFVVRRGAAQKEQGYSQCYAPELNQLAKWDEATQGDKDQGIVRALVRADYAESERDSHFGFVKRQLYTGMNLAQALRNSDGMAIGYVKIATTALPASLTLARALAWYVAVEGEEGVSGHPNGSHTVADPDGQLYNFLMSVPSAYTDSMVGLGGDHKRSASLFINDHGAGFPEGASCMQFDHARNSETGARELRVQFLKDLPAPVFAPLKNADQARGRIALDAYFAQLRAENGETESFPGQTPETLRNRLAEVNVQLAEQEPLTAADQQRAKDLENWVQPEFMPGALPKPQS